MQPILSRVTAALFAAALIPLGACGLSASAHAGGWTGFYAGGHGGGSYGEAGGPGNLLDLPQAQALDLDGGLGGLHAGYNFFAVGQFLIGIEADCSWTSASDGLSVVIFGDTINIENSLDNLASLRGRAGVTLDQVLLYATAGIAWTTYDMHASATFDDGAGGVGKASVRLSDDLTGYVVGGGAEWRIWQNVSLRAEALHYGFGDADLSARATSGETIAGKVDVDTTVVRGGLSWHFN